MPQAREDYLGHDLELDCKICIERHEPYSSCDRDLCQMDCDRTNPGMYSSGDLV